MSGTNARPLLRMTCANKLTPGEGHASLPVYHHPPGRPRLRRTALPASRPPHRPRPQVQGRGPVGRPVLGGRPHQFAGRRLCQPARRTVGHGCPRCLAGYPARVCRAAAPPQPRSGGRPAQGSGQASPAAGVRPDLGPLPRPAAARRRRGLPPSRWRRSSNGCCGKRRRPACGRVTCCWTRGSARWR